MNEKDKKLETIKAGIQTIGIVAICGTGLILGCKLLDSNKVIQPKTYQYSDVAEVSQKTNNVEYLKTNEVVENLQQVNNLEVLQINASTSYDVSLGNYKWTTKTKNIKFYGLGSYKINLSSLRQDQVIVNGPGKTVTLLLEKDNIEIDCNILEDKTTYMDVYEGHFAWYDFKLTPEEVYNIETKAKESLLNNKLSLEDNKNEIIKRCEMSLQGILDSFTAETYRVYVKYVG